MKARLFFLPLYFVAILLLIVGCQKQNDEGFSHTPTTSNQISLRLTQENLTGEDLFRTIFFLDGELVYEIPFLANAADEFGLEDLKAANEEGFEEISNVQDLVVYTIDSIDTTFFSRFKTDLLSNNYEIIQNALEEAGVMYQTAELSSNFLRNIFNTVEHMSQHPEDYQQLEDYESLSQEEIDIIEQQIINDEDIPDPTMVAAFVVVVAIAALAYAYAGGVTATYVLLYDEFWAFSYMANPGSVLNDYTEVVAPQIADALADLPVR